MNRGFRESSRQIVCVLAVFGILVVAAPGCGDETKKTAGAGAGPIPASVQESNKNMQDYMKTKPATKKP